MELAIIAAVAMLFQDLLGTLMVQAEASSLTLPERRTWRDYIGGGWRAWGAALMDQSQWMVWAASTTIVVSAFSGHNFDTKVLVFLFVSMANIIGTRTGQELGIWLLRRRKPDYVSIEDRVERLEEALQVGTSSPPGHKHVPHP
jgi:hypothetical protein